MVRIRQGSVGHNGTHIQMNLCGKLCGARAVVQFCRFKCAARTLCDQTRKPFPHGAVRNVISSLPSRVAQAANQFRVIKHEGELASARTSQLTNKEIHFSLSTIIHATGATIEATKTLISNGLMFACKGSPWHSHKRHGAMCCKTFNDALKVAVESETYQTVRGFGAKKTTQINVVFEPSWATPRAPHRPRAEITAKWSWIHVLVYCWNCLCTTRLRQTHKTSWPKLTYNTYRATTARVYCVHMLRASPTHAQNADHWMLDYVCHSQNPKHPVRSVHLLRAYAAHRMHHVTQTPTKVISSSTCKAREDKCFFFGTLHRFFHVRRAFMACCAWTKKQLSCLQITTSALFFTCKGTSPHFKIYSHTHAPTRNFRTICSVYLCLHLRHERCLWRPNAKTNRQRS